jgi:hypothetical protein
VSAEEDDRLNEPEEAAVLKNPAMFPSFLPCLVVALVVLLIGTSTAHAQSTFYVRAGAGANGNGTDWNNAFPALPTSLTRGSTYYIAAGTYGGYTFDDAASGTSLITIKKATASDHGTAIGWQAGYTSQAIFTNTLAFITSNYVFDGQIRNADWRTGYGFKVDVSGAGGNYGIQIGIPFNTNVSNITIRYTEVQGTGSQGPLQDRGIIAAMGTSQGSSNITISYGYVHDQGNCNFHMFRTQNLTIEYTWIARNHSDPVNHAEGIAAPEGVSNFIFRYNVMEDIEGTAYIATPTGDHPACAGTTQSNWYIYGNVFVKPTNPKRSATGNGVIYVFDANHTGDFFVYNNTIVGVDNGFVGFEAAATSRGCAQSASIRNNLWYNVGSTVSPTTSVANLTWTHNAYFNTATSDTNANRQVAGTNPLVNVPAYDFRLAVATSSGVSLAAPYNTDSCGSTRGGDGVWDRGAFEFPSASTCVSSPPPNSPAAPTNLHIVN